MAEEERRRSAEMELERRRKGVEERKRRSEAAMEQKIEQAFIHEKNVCIQ